MTEKEQKTDVPEKSHTTGFVENNIRALINRQVKEEQGKSFKEKIGERIGRFTGNLAFIYTHAIVFGSWLIWNLGWLGLKPFDPSFIGLQLITAIEAIFLTTFVLMSQNSLDTQADKRAELDLQISLLSEHEITRLISLIKGIAQKLDVEEAKNPEIEELSKDVRPDKLMDTLESEKQKSIRNLGT